MAKKKQAGDVVSIIEEGYAFGKIGRIVKFPNPVSQHTAVMFPRFLAARWFDQHNCIHATEAERKIYFMDILKHGEKFTN